MLTSVQVARAAAALLVLVFHVSQHMVLALNVPGFREMTFGAGGVDLFFVISGFIMVWSCRDLAGQPGVRGDFLLRRAIRVVPLYWTITTGFVLAMLAIRLLRPSFFAFALDPGHVLASYLFLPWPYVRGGHMPVFAVGWTLDHEMAFYAAFALLLGLPIRLLVPVLTALFLGLVALGLAVELPFAPAVWTRPIILEFVLGAWLGVARLRGVSLPGWARLALLAAGLAGMAMAAVDPNERGLGRVLGWGLPSMAIMAGVVLGGDVTLRGAGLRVLALLGDASYALYLVHFFVVSGMRPFAMPFRELILAAPWAYALGLGAVAIGASLAVHLWVERPMHDALMAWRRRRMRAA